MPREEGNAPETLIWTATDGALKGKHLKDFEFAAHFDSKNTEQRARLDKYAPKVCFAQEKLAQMYLENGIVASSMIIGAQRIQSMSWLPYLVGGLFLITIFLTYLFGFLHYKKCNKLISRKDAKIFVSMASTVIPIFMALAFTYVSKFSQHNGFMSFWLSMYFTSLWFAGLATLLSLVSLFIELKPKSRPYSFLCRLFSVLSLIPMFTFLWWIITSI